MRSLNKVMIIGQLGREPELRYTPGGKAVASFGVETRREWTSPDGQRHEESEWFNVVAWGALAEICRQHLARGQQVYVEGRLQTRSWDDPEGRRHYRTEIVANEMIILGPRRQHLDPSPDPSPDEHSGLPGASGAPSEDFAE